MFNAFYAKLALANIRRDKRTYVPHIIATAVISGVYLLIAGLMFSYGLANLTSGKTTQAMFSFGMVVFSIFAFFFMLYVNNFLIGRRKREFGLYAVRCWGLKSGMWAACLGGKTCSRWAWGLYWA